MFFSLSEFIENLKILINKEANWNEILLIPRKDKSFLNCLDSEIKFKSIILEGNEIDDSYALKIANLIKYNNNFLELNLSRNKLGLLGGKLIGQSLSFNNNLVHLNLEGNNIGNVGAKAISESLQLNASRLMILNLNSNGITDSGAGWLSLAVKKCDSLIILKLEYNNIGQEGAKYIYDSIAERSYFKEFLFEGNPVSLSYIDTMKESTSNLQLEKNIETIINRMDKECILSNIKIGPIHSKLIGESISKSTSIKIVKLINCEITEIGLKMLINYLSQSNISEFTLSNYKIQSEQFENLEELITNNNNLKKLHLSISLTNDTIQKLSKYLENSNIRLIDLSKSSIDFEQFNTLCLSLKTMSKLHKLDLSSCNIQKNVSNQIGEILIDNKVIKKLLLNNNNLEDEGFISIISSLKNNNNLIELSVENNNITLNSIQSFKEILPTTSIRFLNLSNNKINDSGITELSEGLQSFTKLHFLSLGGNKISDNSLNILIESLKQHKKLSTLYLNDNEITFEGSIHIANYIQSNKSLLNLNLSGNKLCCKGVEKIMESLASNSNLKVLVFLIIILRMKELNIYQLYWKIILHFYL